MKERSEIVMQIHHNHQDSESSRFPKNMQVDSLKKR